MEDKLKKTSQKNIISEAEYKGKDVDLNKPFRSTDTGKKYSVYVKDPKTGNVKKVNFGDKNMEIKRDDPERRKAFRARHKCDTAKNKTSPRYWSCKFWSTKSVSDLLNEIVDPKEVEVGQLELKETLNPDIFDENGTMYHPIRKKLLENVIEFIKFANLENIPIKDIILTGSIANYNWHDESDIDLHILIDFSDISDNIDFISDYYRTKKNIWNDRMQTQINNHDIELYVQDINEPHSSTGIYSIYENQWLTKPIKEMVTIDSANLQLKAADLMNKIDEIIEKQYDKNKPEVIDKVMDKLKKYRKIGLERQGEYSPENLVFKILRNNDYLREITELKRDVLKKQLSLKNK